VRISVRTRVRRGISIKKEEKTTTNGIGGRKKLIKLIYFHLCGREREEKGGHRLGGEFRVKDKRERSLSYWVKHETKFRRRGGGREIRKSDCLYELQEGGQNQGRGNDKKTLAGWVHISSLAQKTKEI